MLFGASAVSTSGTKTQLKVFISYSRRDLSFADELVPALENAGFQVLIDRRDLPYGEEWQKELGDFIRDSDTVIWLVSPDSVSSDWCNWELGVVGQLKKRLIPIKVRDTDLSLLPKAIGKIHLLPAEGIFSLDAHLETLVDVLNTDRAWLKEATRLADRSRQWLTKQRDGALLLRGAALKDAEQWERSQPANAPAAPGEVLELILSSRQAAARRQRYWVGGSFTVAVGALGLAGIAYLQSIEAKRQETLAVEARIEETKQRKIAEEREEQAKQARDSEREARQAEETQRKLAEQREQQAQEARKAEEAQRKLAQEEADRANRERDRALTSQSNFLADQVKRQIASGEAITGALLALEALPDNKAARVRPYVEAAERSLLEALHARQEFQVIRAHSGSVNQIATAPGGDVFVSLGSDGKVKLWTKDGNLIGELTGHNDAIVCMAISPDGTYLATGSQDKTARLWKLDGNPLGELVGHTETVTSIEITPDSKRVITGSEDGTARIWSVKGDGLGIVRGDGTPIKDIAIHRNGQTFATLEKQRWQLWGPQFTGKGFLKANFMEDWQQIEFSPKHDRAVVRSWLGSIEIIDLKNGEVTAVSIDKEALNPGEESGGYVSFGHVEFAPDGMQLLLHEGGGNYVKLINLDGTVANSIVREGSVLAAHYSQNGQYIALAGEDGPTKVVDMDGKSVAQLKGHTGHVQDVRFIANDTRVVTGGADGTLRIWSIAQSNKDRVVLKGHEGEISLVATDPSAEVVATVSWDGSLRLWDTTGSQIAEAEKFDIVGSGYSLAFHPKKEILYFAATRDGADAPAIHVFDFSLHQLNELKIDGENIIDIVFSKDARLAAASAEQHKIHIVDLESGEHSVLAAEKGYAMSMQFDSGGTRLLAAFSDMSAWLWELKGGKSTTYRDAKIATDSDASQSEEPESEPLSFVARFHPSESFFVLGAIDDSVHFVNLKGDKIGSATTVENEHVHEVSFTPDGASMLLSENMGEWVRPYLWEVEYSDGLVKATLREDLERLGNVASLSPVGSLVGEAFHNGPTQRSLVRLFNIDGSEIANIDDFTGDIYSLAFSADGRWLMGGSSEKEAHLWRVFEVDATNKEASASEKFDTTQAAVDYAKRTLPRCLTKEQRTKFFLDPELPTWCKEMGKWPFPPITSVKKTEPSVAAKQITGDQTSIDPSIGVRFETNWGQAEYETGLEATKKNDWTSARTSFRRAHKLGHPTAEIVNHIAAQRLSRDLSKDNKFEDALIVLTKSFLDLQNTFYSKPDQIERRMYMFRVTDPIAGIYSKHAARTRQKTRCDELATHPSDPFKITDGVPHSDIKAKEAIAACSKEIMRAPQEANFYLQRARGYSKAAEDAEEVGETKLASKHYESMIADLKKATQLPTNGLDGHPTAFNNLGYAYLNGEGFKEDDAKGVQYYIDTFNRMAICCAVSVSRRLLDWATASTREDVKRTVIALLRWAGQLGSAEAHAELAKLYEVDGKAADHRVEAYFHASLAKKILTDASADSPLVGELTKLGQRIELSLSSEESQQAREKVAGWKKSELTAAPFWLVPQF